MKSAATGRTTLDPVIRAIEGFVFATIDPRASSYEPTPPMCRVVVRPPGFAAVDYVAELDAIQAHPEFHARRIVAGIQASQKLGLLTPKGKKRTAYYDDPK